MPSTRRKRRSTGARSAAAPSRPEKRVARACPSPRFAHLTRSRDPLRLRRGRRAFHDQIRIRLCPDAACGLHTRRLQGRPDVPSLLGSPEPLSHASHGLPELRHRVRLARLIQLGPGRRDRRIHEGGRADRRSSGATGAGRAGRSRSRPDLRRQVAPAPERRRPASRRPGGAVAEGRARRRRKTWGWPHGWRAETRRCR